MQRRAEDGLVFSKMHPHKRAAAGSVGGYQRPSFVGRYVAAGVLAGLGATCAELLLFFAPGRGPVPPELGRVGLFSAAVYCSVGMVLSIMAWSAYLAALRFFALTVPREVLPVSSESLARDQVVSVRAVFAFRATVSLACLAGLALSLGKLLNAMAPIPTPLRRALFMSLGSGLIAAGWLVAYQILLRRQRLIHLGLTRLFKPLLVGVCVAIAATAYAAWRAPFNQLAYGLLIAEAFVLPVGAMMVASVFQKRSLNGTIVAAGLGIVLLGGFHGPSAQSLYTLRVARSLPPVLLRELPKLGLAPELARLESRTLGLFQLDLLQRSRRPSTLAVPSGPRPDIILLTIDTLRADRVLPAQGTSVMPNLRAFAQSATQYRRAFASAGATVQAMTQLMTGVREHTLTHLRAAPGATAQLDPTTITISRRLRKSGYWTEGIMGGGLKSYFPSLAIGFDQVRELDFNTRAPLHVDGVVTSLLQALDDAPAPAFLWGHVMDLHDFFRGAADLGPRYDQAARTIDVALGKFFRQLSQTERGRNAIVVVTSDHGEGLGEGRLVAHGFCHALILPVPLIVRFPGAPAGAVVDATVGHLDIAPTILHAAGLPTNDLHGRDLGTVSEARPWPLDRVFFEHAGYSAKVDVSEFGVVAYPWLYSYDVRLGVPSLIDLQSDPNGTRNLAARGQREENILRELLADSFDAAPSRAD
jgi:hypothetical protein